MSLTAERRFFVFIDREKLESGDRMATPWRRSFFEQDSLAVI
uniref:Uncharacterized protein n=1 Tax=Yersinia enterocolitica W22703 TaxID=913028 RepID=F4MYD9_YEREN|nr:unknown protein [Yersinia enterocolitica W22703]